MHRLRIAILGAVVASMLMTPAVIAASPGGAHPTDGTTTRAYVDKTMALVQLSLPPVTTAPKTKPAPGKKVDFNNSVTKSYRALLSAQRNEFKKWMQVNAPKARVTGEFDLTLNAVAVKLNGSSIAKLREAPQAIKVQYQGLYYPNDAADPDLKLINAIEAWETVGGPANAGKGVRVGVIDSGIDQGHPCFDGEGYVAPAGFPRGTPAFTNNKVIVAKVFNNKARSRGYTAEAIDYHGTHVAGTIACNLDTPIEMPPYEIPYKMSGVAPAAFLGNYNVFPGDVDNARSEDILNALDAAFADGMDVMNMSLGGNAHGIQDLLTNAVDNLDIANVVVAISAGNEGAGDPTTNPPTAPGHYTVGSPGSAARALTAGATETGQGTKTEVSVVGMPSPFYAVPGDFGIPSVALTAPIAILTSPTVNDVSGYSIVCTAADAAALPDLTGKIAVLGRGVCDFSTKVRYAEKAGAVGVVVVNRVLGEAPFIMGTGESPDDIQPVIPAYMISTEDGIALRKASPSKDGAAGTMGVPFYFLDDAIVNAQTDFTSQGPTDVDFRVKPDLMAPGGNVISSIPVSYCGGDPCFAFLSGTSMASPHLAGTAAVVRAEHPGWTAEQVRSAITNTAVQGVVDASGKPGTVETDVNIVGAGLADVDAALGARVAIGPVSTSFGAVPSISGQVRSANVTITNLSGASGSWDIAIVDYDGPGGVAFSVSSSHVDLASGASKTIVVTMAAAKGAKVGDHQAFLNVSAGSTLLAHAAVYAFVK